MREIVQIQYDVNALRRRIPQDRAEFFLGFTPWEEDMAGWRRVTKELHPETQARSLARTVWDDPDNRKARILIEVVECMSAVEALEALIDRLEWNQLARLEEGPQDLGEAAFVHPQGVPPAIYFTRGNLCLSLVSFGQHPVLVQPWAERLSRRLGKIPEVDRMTISLRIEADKVKVGQELDLSYELPWKCGEEGYLKFLVQGGTLLRRDDRLILLGTRSGELNIQTYLLEPGREPGTGHLRVMVN